MKIRATATLTAALLAVGLGAGSAPAADAQGFLYGTVTTTTGSAYQGFLRWGGEEAFWGDLFNSTKDDDRYDRHVPRAERRSRGGVEVFGVRLGITSDGDPDRVFVARFGDIATIEVDSGDEATVTLKSGTRYRVRGGANDVDADITVRDAALGEITVPWRKVEKVELQPAPADAAPYAARLFGTLATRSGSFQGFVQWDSEECLSTDLLDGDSEDGRLKIAMGQIRAIARHSRNSARVELVDGRALVLDGTNDVDSSIRGILVEDPRFGRVEVSWDAFERLDLTPAPSSGPGYESFAAAGPLRGTVTAAGGAKHTGRIVFDIDEAEGWEILHGSADDVEYLIPFSLVASVEPTGRRASRVTLRSGHELRLEDSQDVTADNAGVLVFGDAGGDPVYIAWDEVDRIDLLAP